MQDKYQKIPLEIVDEAEKSVKKLYNEFSLFDAICFKFREGGYRRDSPPNPKGFKGGEDYQFIPLSADTAYRSLFIARKLFYKHFVNHRIDTFVDVGSGIGNILFMYEYFFHKEDQWSNGPDYIGIEKYHREPPLLKVPTIIKDAIDITTKDLGNQSIIYLYNPLSDTTKMQKVLDNLIEVAPVKCVIVFARSSAATLVNGGDRKHIAQITYLRNATGRENVYSNYGQEFLVIDKT